MSDYKSDKIKVDSEILQQLKIRAAIEGETMKNIVESLIISYLRDSKKIGSSSKNHAQPA